jgi:hypothetical protein
LIARNLRQHAPVADVTAVEVHKASDDRFGSDLRRSGTGTALLPSHWRVGSPVRFGGVPLFTGESNAPTWVTPDEWDEVFAVNVRGVFLMSRAFIPAMIRRLRAT